MSRGKIYKAKIKSTEVEIEVYKSSTDTGVYVNADDCNTSYLERELIMLGEVEKPIAHSK